MTNEKFKILENKLIENGDVNGLIALHVNKTILIDEESKHEVTVEFTADTHKILDITDELITKIKEKLKTAAAK